MNQKIKKILATSIFAFLFLFSVTSCNSKDKYLEGGVCGIASAEGDNAFSEIRRFYVEEFVYELNYDLVVNDDTESGYKQYDFAEIYSTKYTLNESNELKSITLEESKEDNIAYKKAHYLFTFYYETGENGEKGKEIVDNYIDNYFSSDTTKAAKYKEVVDLCAFGPEDNKNYGYFAKVNKTDYDSDSANDGKIKSVSSRMTSHSKACLVFGKDEFNDPTTGVSLVELKWKDAWSKSNGGGLLFGLLVYPLAWFINLFVTLFNGKTSGLGQIAAILTVTIVIKLLILLCTFKSQRSTQKMQDIQPEILKLQAKYGQNPTPEQKQKMSMEMMEIYKKYGVKPLAPFASMLITFPVFIAMYRAVMYLAVLRTGDIGGLILGNNLNLYFINSNYWGVPETIIAVVIFILMAGSQIMSMKLPQILNSKRMTREAKQQQKQMGMVSNIMMIMILVMGFMMPVTMSIYWIASAIVSIIQALIMHKLNNSSKTGRYKVKKAEEKPITIPQGYKK